MSENRNRTNDRPLFILQYLIRNTDDDHKVSLTQLMDVCKAKRLMSLVFPSLFLINAAGLTDST